MRKTWIRTALCALLTATAIFPCAAVDAGDTEDSLYFCDFEHMTTATMQSETALNYAKKTSDITIETLDGSQVLCFHHRKTDVSEDCFIDVLPNARKWGLATEYCFSYDFRYTGAPAFTWQVLCSRQTPASGTQFQQMGYVQDGVLTVNGTSVSITLEADRWYRFAAAVNETENRFDLYLDGVMIAEAVPFSIGDSSELYPDRLRIGFGGSTAEATAYVDNIRIDNADMPHDLAPTEVIVLSGENAVTVADFPLPTYTEEEKLSATVWYVLGSTASLALAGIGFCLVRRIKGR